MKKFSYNKRIYLVSGIDLLKKTDQFTNNGSYMRMLMKYLLLVALVATSFSGLAHANNGIYASIKSGISDTKMKDNRVNFYDNYEGSHLIIEYYQKDQSKSIYPNISAAIGFDFSKISPVDARLELEYSYKDNTAFKPKSTHATILVTSPGEPDFHADDIYSHNLNLFSHELKSQSLMFNGYYDFKNKSKFTPYISAGVGMTHVKNDYHFITAPEYGFSKTDHNFTWSAGFGTTYNVTDNVALDLSYRYVNAGKLEFSGTLFDGSSEKTHFKLNSQDYSLGIRYNF